MRQIFSLNARGGDSPVGWWIRADSLQAGLQEVLEIRHQEGPLGESATEPIFVVDLCDLEHQEEAIAAALVGARDMLVSVIFVAPPAAIERLHLFSKAFSELRLAAEKVIHADKPGAFLVSGQSICEMGDNDLCELLQKARGAPVLVTGTLAAAERDFIRRNLRHNDTLLLTETLPEPTPILMVSAQPEGHPPLYVNEEQSLISTVLNKSIPHHQLQDLDQLVGLLQRHRPRILHFAGHGDRRNLWLEGLGNGPHPETGERVAEAIRKGLAVDSPLALIVLNACESEALVEPLCHVCRELVVMRTPISDAAALAFAGAFYASANIDLFRALEEAQTAMTQADPAAEGALVRVEGKICEVEFRPGPSALGAAEVMRSIQPTTVRVWFGTEREPVDPRDLTRGFSNRQGPHLTHGRVDVRVAPGPYGRIGGGLGRSNRAAVQKRTLTGLSASDWQRGLRNDLAEWSARHGQEPHLLLFVHGFNVGFDDAARRAAQIHQDIKVPGVTALYSWASANRVYRYGEDEQRIQAAIPHLQQFIEDLIANSGARRFHLLAHSMGNRALLRALQAIGTRVRNRTGALFGQIFLCAPDLAVSDFRALAASLPGLSDRSTLYISRRDKALLASRFRHRNDRAGLYPEVTVVPGIDTLAAEAVSGALLSLGHSYYGESPAILGDLSRLITTNQAPALRPRLHLDTTPANEPFHRFI